MFLLAHTFDIFKKSLHICERVQNGEDFSEKQLKVLTDQINVLFSFPICRRLLIDLFMRICVLY
jgi:hypothetical protein